MLTYDQFEAEIAPLRTALEQRRRRYLRYFYIGAVISVLLLLSAVICPRLVLEVLLVLFHKKQLIRTSDVIAYCLFAQLCAFLLLLGPVMSYRGTRGLSFEHVVLQRLLGLFGVFIPAKGGGISASEFKFANLSPAAFLLYPEEGASGEMNDVRVRLCEASLISREAGQQDRLVFHGLLIVCDRPQHSAAAQALFDSAATGAGAWDSGLETHLQNAAQAEAAGVLTLRWDERTHYAGRGIYARLKDMVVARMGKDELPSERDYRLKYHLAPRLARPSQPMLKDAKYTPYAAEYAQQAVLVMIAGLNGFFTLGSLFEPALPDARMRRFFGVMQVLDGAVLQLKGA